MTMVAALANSCTTNLTGKEVKIICDSDAVVVIHADAEPDAEVELEAEVDAPGGD